MFQERPHVKFLPTVGIQTAHFEESTKRHTGVLTCNQHKVDVTAGLQVLMQCGSLASLNNDTHPDRLTAIQSRGVAFEGRVMTPRHSHASQLMREAATRLMRPRKGHTLKHFHTGHTNGLPGSRQRTAALLYNRYTDEQGTVRILAGQHSHPQIQRSRIDFTFEKKPARRETEPLLASIEFHATFARG